MDVRRDIGIVLARWGRLGVGVGGPMAPASPDVERLILDTTRCGAASPQVVVVAVTWLSRYGNLVAEHRLAAMVQRETVDRARLGLLLALAIEGGRQHDRRRNLGRTVKLCAPAADPSPFFEASRTSPAMIERSRRRASATSGQWNLWMDPVEPKHDALRPISWIVERNPSVRMRADFRGDLRASILLSLAHEAGSATISRIARLIGASRLATVHALEELELGGHITCERVGRTRTYRRDAA